MQIVIQNRGFKVSEPVRRQVERQIRFNLTRYESEVRRLEILLTEDPIVSAGDSHSVRIRVRLNTPPDVIVEDVERDFHTAVDRAIGRAARAVKHRVIPRTLHHGVN